MADSIKEFKFNTKNEFHQFIIKHTDFLKDLVSIQNSSGISYNFNRNSLYEFLKTDFKNNGSVFFIYENKEPIGAIWGYRDPFGDKEFTLSFFAIKKEYQGKGLGKKLMKFVYDKLLKTKRYNKIGMISEKGTRAINERLTGKKGNSSKYTLKKNGCRDEITIKPKLRHIL